MNTDQTPWAKVVSPLLSILPVTLAAVPVLYGAYLCISPIFETSGAVAGIVTIALSPIAVPFLSLSQALDGDLYPLLLILGGVFIVAPLFETIGAILLETISVEKN